VLLDHLLLQAGVDPGAVDMLDRPARNEADVAQAIADDKADVGLAIESVARQYRLDFVPVQVERYDLVVWRHAWFEEPMQALLAFCRGNLFRDRATELGGYDITGLGDVRYNGP
jgi:molybdate-binding protein